MNLLVVKPLLDVRLVQLEDDLLLELDLFALQVLNVGPRLHPLGHRCCATDLIMLTSNLGLEELVLTCLKLVIALSCSLEGWLLLLLLRWHYRIGSDI